MKEPYFINPDIDALPSASGEERIRLIRHIAACVGDEATLRTLIGIDPEEFRSFYPDMTAPELSTDQTITSFIDRFASDRKAETPEVEQIIAAPAIDYASMLEDDEDDTDHGDNEDAGTMAKDETSDAISAFLAEVPVKKPIRRQPELSEGLLKLMVKNHNYAKALEIIDELSLNNPKKSIYFAYQKRFLEKLVRNQADGRKATD